MDKQPNILLITTDQQRFDTIQTLGNDKIYTPHLDWLVRQGTTFERCYSDCPICMPARATIMTGLYGYNHGLTGNGGDIMPMKDNPTLPGILTRNGYQTRAQGKMHFHPIRSNYGFENMELLHDYYRYMEKHPDKGVPMDHGVGQNEMTPVISTVNDTNSLTHWIVDRSIDFLETRDETRPFFLWTSFAKPHPPFDPALEYWQLYDTDDMPDPWMGEWSKDPSQIPQSFMQPTYLLNNIQEFSEKQVKAARRAYYACISQIDYNLGLLFSRVRELGLLENTWIIFTSDHGENLGDHNMGAKTNFMEGSTHIPLIIRKPGFSWNPDPDRGQRDNNIVCLADILPTCLDMAGVDTDHSFDGISLFQNEKREYLYGNCTDYSMVLNDEWKYQFSPIGESELLFNLKEDPCETIDRSKDGDVRNVLDSLRSIAYAKLKAMGNEAAGPDGLKITGEPETPREVGSYSWPGFHSRKPLEDVLH